MDQQASLLGIEILKAARRWVAARVLLRQALDSKSIKSEQLEKVKADHVRVCNELEALVMRLERHLHNNGRQFPTKRAAPGRSGQFPWESFFGMVSAGAKAVESALSGARPVVEAKIIDVDPPSKK
jgi:hypothetical protein